MSSLSTAIQQIKKVRPLIHNITNLVATEFSANALLSLGASPLMAHAPEELEEIIQLSNALVLNIGTIDVRQRESMFMALSLACQKDIPILLDPVGAGASKFRTQTALDLLQHAKEKRGRLVLKGNASEIMSLAGHFIQSKGVDSNVGADSADYLLDAAKNLITTYNIETVGITGKDDFIVGKNNQHALNSHGHPLMSQITATGCILTAITAAFCAVDSDLFSATQNAFKCLSLAGEASAEKSQGQGLGSFKVQLINELSLL